MNEVFFLNHRLWQGLHKVLVDVDFLCKAKVSPTAADLLKVRNGLQDLREICWEIRNRSRADHAMTALNPSEELTFTDRMLRVVDLQLADQQVLRRKAG